MPRILEVIPSRFWKNKVTGARASLYGAVPYYSEKDKAEWEVVTAGWTWRDSDGTIGLGRVPAKTREEAEEVMRKINSL